MKQLPQNIEAEKILLGCILINPSIVEDIQIQPDIFYYEKHKIIIESILEIKKQDKEINILSTSEQLKINNKLENIGGRAYINDLALEVISTASYEYYYKLIKEKSELRKIIKFSENILQEAYSGEKQAECILTSVSDEIYKLNITKEEKEGQFLDDVLLKNYEKISERYNNFQETGKVYFDNCIKLSEKKPKLTAFLEGGFYNSDLIFIAARSGSGKTAFLNDLALDVATNSENKNTPIAIFQLEMKAEAIGNRALSNVSGVKKSYFKYVNNLQDYHFKSICSAIKKISEINKIKIFDNPDFTIPEIEFQTKKFFNKHGKGIVFIDNLQIINHDLHGKGDVQIVDYLTRKLKAFAKRIQAPVVVLTQLAKESWDDSEPQLKDVRGSGQIIANADIVLLLHNTKDDEKEPTLKIIIGKNRDGVANARIESRFDMTTGRFVER